MKYVRTPDGRILEYNKLNKISKLSIDTAEEPIREANTIEELCDEFIELVPKYKGNDIVGYSHDRYEYSVSDNKFYNDIGECYDIEDFIYRGYDVFGGIWNDKGFDYVTKLNKNKVKFEVFYK